MLYALSTDLRHWPITDINITLGTFPLLMYIL